MNFINSFTLTGKQKEYLKDLTEKIKSIMSSSLYQHSINTLEYASTIAQKYLSDIEFFDLGVACILHDYGKIFNYEELVKIAKENELEVGSFELNSPLLLHSFVGDYLVLRDFNVSSSKILKAIKFHAIGYCNMNLADKILFIADKVEKSRNYNGVKKLRDLALKNINLCLLEVYKNNIMYIIKRDRFLHPDTVKIWNNICGGV